MRKWLAKLRIRKRLRAYRKGLYFVALIIPLLSGLIYIFVIRPISVRMEFKQGWSECRKGNYTIAISNYQRFIIRHPYSPLVKRALFEVGNIYYLYLRDCIQAVSSLNRLLQRNPSPPYEFRARMLLAHIYQDEYGDYQRAIEQYSRLLDSFSEQDQAGEACFRLAECYYQLNDIPKAIEHYQNVIKRDDNQQWVEHAYLRLASCLRLQGDLEGAIQAYRNLLSRGVSGQTESFARMNLAECLEDKREYKEALEVLEGVPAGLGDKEAISRKMERLKSSIESRSLAPPGR